MANLLVILIQVLSLARMAAPSRPHGFLTHYAPCVSSSPLCWMQSTHIKIYPACSRWNIHQCQYLHISSYHSINMISCLGDVPSFIKKYIFHQYTWGCNTALYFILFWINKILTFLYTIVGICIFSSNKQPPPIWVQSVIAVKELQLVLTSWATRNTLKMRWSPSGNSNMSRY